MEAAPELPELVLVEGDEEVQYVLMEIPNGLTERLAPGTSFSLVRIDSDHPTLRLQDGTELRGEFEEPLGSVLFFQRTIAAPAADPQGSGATSQPAATVTYRGTCESKLVFRAPRPKPLYQARPRRPPTGPQGVGFQGTGG